MASNAISAQGSTLKIETGTGSAKTVSGIAVGFPTILTSTAHGLSNGDVVTLANFAGADAATLNGNNYVVQNVTANTFAVDVNTTGLAITDNTAAATATPVAFTQIKELKTFSGFDGQASEIDVTNLDSAAKEFRLGLVDEGGFSFEMNQVNSDVGQSALRTSREAGTMKTYVLTLPNGETATFDAFAKAVPTAGGVDGVVTSSVALRISGSVVWA
jgi:hypothetical protein